MLASSYQRWWGYLHFVSRSLYVILCPLSSVFKFFQISTPQTNKQPPSAPHLPLTNTLFLINLNNFLLLFPYHPHSPQFILGNIASDRVLVMVKCGSQVNSTIKDDCYSPLPSQPNHSPLETLPFLDTLIRALCVGPPPPWHLSILLPRWLLFLYLMSHREGPQDSTLRPSFRFIQSLSLGEIFVPMVLVTLILP